MKVSEALSFISRSPLVYKSNMGGNFVIFASSMLAEDQNKSRCTSR